MRYEALSLVRVPRAFEQKSKDRIEKDKTQPNGLKMDSVLHVKRFNPIPFLNWEREKTERRELKINSVYPSLFDSTRTHNFPHETLWYSPYFLYFCEFQKEICRALSDIG